MIKFSATHREMARENRFPYVSKTISKNLK